MPWILVLLALAGWLRAADTPDERLAARILAAVGRPVGLLHLPRGGDGGLALACARAQPQLLVHGQEADDARVLEARRRADAAGLFGRRAWLDRGDLRRLLPAGRSVDLLALTDLRREELTPALAAEIRRVLHPWYGAAVLGSAAGPLDAAALAAWAGGIARQVEPVPGDGALVLVRADALPGSDDWPMWWHGPDNNCVSTDTAFALPATLQWTGKPWFGPTRLELPIVAGGRLYMLWNGYADWPLPSIPMPFFFEQGAGPILMAHAVGSGVRLWARRLSTAQWTQFARSVLVADGDRLLVADGDQVIELDGATGAELRRLRVDAPEIKWMALDGGRLFILAGDARPLTNQRKINTAYLRSGATHLAVYDRASFALRWRVDRRAGADVFDPRSAAIAGDRLFLCLETAFAEQTGTPDTLVTEAFAVADGHPLWRTSHPVEHLKVDYVWDVVSRHPVIGYALYGTYVVADTTMREAVAVSQADGGKLWTTRVRAGSAQFIPVGFRGLLWPTTYSSRSLGFDPRTGVPVEGSQPVAGFSMLRESCSRSTMAPFLAEMAYDPPETLKTSCSAGSFVANGLLWKFPVPCANCVEWRGFMQQAAAERNLPPPPERLVVAAAAASTVTAPQPAGWLGYRGDERRSGSTATPIPAQAGIAWTLPPVHAPGTLSKRSTDCLWEVELVPAPPVVAGDRIVVAHADGAVDGIDLADGRRAWRAYTSGRIQSSPAVWRDRVFVGSCDGHLYAFALADGRELWRLRVAPEAGRIMLYEQFGSRWPVVGAPLVADDAVVAVAGLVGMIDGVHAVCVDAATGRVRWERDASVGMEGGRLSGGAQLARDGGRIFGQGGMGPPWRVGLVDGVVAPALPSGLTGAFGSRLGSPFRSILSVKGQDIGVLSDAWLVIGGRRIWTDQAEEGPGDYPLTFIGRGRDGDGDGAGTMPALMVKDVTLLPAWDAQTAVFVSRRGFRAGQGKPTAGLVMIRQERLHARLAALAPEDTTARIRAVADPGKVPKDLFIQQIDLAEDGLADWTSQLATGWPSICVLAGDAVLVADRMRDQQKLRALDRRDGSVRWEVDLPARPMHNGLAIAADGTLVLALIDGTILAVAAPGRHPQRGRP